MRRPTPSSLKLADPFQLDPVKLSSPKDCDVVHAGMTSVLLRLAARPIRLRPWRRAERKKLTAGAVPAQMPSSRLKEHMARPDGKEFSVACRAS